MSRWTHVCGNIRVNSIRHSHSELEIEDHLKRFESILEVDNEIPEGSEGPLKYDFWVESNNDALASYNIAIFGDLRDYTDVGYIERWFRCVLRDLWVREAILAVTLESSKHIFTPNKDFYLKKGPIRLKEYVMEI